MDMDSDKPLLPRPTQSPQAQPRRGTQVHQPSSRLSNVTDVTEDSDTVRYGLSTTSSTFTFEKCYERVGLGVWTGSTRSGLQDLRLGLLGLFGLLSRSLSYFEMID